MDDQLLINNRQCNQTWKIFMRSILTFTAKHTPHIKIYTKADRNCELNIFAPVLSMADPKSDDQQEKEPKQ